MARLVIRDVAGDPEDLHIMYGIGGERRHDEYELGWLLGYEGSAPCGSGTLPRACAVALTAAAGAWGSTVRNR